MGFTDLFIRRPVATTLISIGMLLFGVMGYLTMPTTDMPAVDFPTIQVTAGMPGANPETMASTVATPLEGAFADISDVVSMTSSSSTGQTAITLQFGLDRNIDAAAQDVQAAISKAVLPQGLPRPPVFSKVNPSDQPILYITMGSETLPLSTVNEYADLYVAKRISTIKGVSQVVVYGEQKYAVRILLDPKVLVSREIGLDDVQVAVARENVSIPTGSLDGQYKSRSINTEGQLLRASDYRPIIVAYRGGRPIRLEELGEVVDSVYLNKMAAWWKGQRALILAVKRQPGANTIAAVDAIRQILPEIENELPGSIQMGIIYDQSESIRESVADVKFTLIMAVVLVILVVALFLRNITATVVTSLAVPMSLIPAFAVMKALGFSLDNLSLMALTLSVGFVVDDAIVMLENVVRHMEMGKGPFEAALDGAREIGFTILSMTLSLAVVFLPIVFMSGMVGRILSEFAITLIVAILVSGFVSLTLTPMMASRFLRPMKGRAGAETGHGEGREDHEAEGGLILRIYAWSLRFVLRHRILTVLCFFATLGITGYMFMLIPKGFIPSEDRGMIVGFGMAAEGISYEDMSEHMLAVSDIISDDPNVDGVMPVVGFGGSMNAGFYFIKLKERHERKATPEQVMAQLYPRTSQVPGIITFFSNPPPIQVSAKSSNAAYQYVLQSTNTDELYDASKAFLQKLMALPQLRDVNSDLMISTPQIKVRIDRDKAATLGLSAQQIEGTLSRAFASPQITTIYGATDQYQVIMELDPQYRKYPEDLFQLHIRSLAPGGKLVPIEEVVSYERVLGPLQLNHVGQLPGVTISFNTRPGVPLSEATGAVRKAAAETLPPTVSGAFSGTAEEFQKSLSSLFWLLLVALAVIYLILGILYESFIHPVTILAGLPSAALGALVTLHLFHAELQIYAFLGIIMLIGIVKKNAIMMIDFALEAERTRNMDAKEAIYQGAVLRFRPIMMTTIAAFAGILPIAVGYGAGGASKQPLGLAVCGGLVVSQLITLLVTPVIYTYFDEFGGKLKRRKEER